MNYSLLSSKSTKFENYSQKNNWKWKLSIK
jgi:hypothetical protein